MNQKAKQALIEKFTKASTVNDLVTIKHNGTPIALVYPIDTPQKFQAERDREFRKLKIELDHLLAFVRSRIKQAPEEVEAELATHRQKIKESLQESDDTL
jgi:hypothetical protein